MVFKPGQSGNPKGRASGRQAFQDRAKYLLDQYTAGQILELIADPDKFSALPSYDAMILRRAAEAIGDNGRQSMDSLLDRLLGKPDTNVAVDHTGTVTHEHGGLSATSEWLAGLIGDGQADTPAKPVLN